MGVKPGIKGISLSVRVVSNCVPVSLVVYDSLDALLHPAGVIADVTVLQFSFV